MKKKHLMWMSLFLLGSWILHPGSIFAKPEVIEIKSKERVKQEEQLKQKLEAMDLEAIEDPTAEAAIKAMMAYMGVRKPEADAPSRNR